MAEFKRDDRVMILAHFLGRDGDSGKDLVGVLTRDDWYSRRLLFEPEELRHYHEQPAAHPLDAAVAELGRVTGLRGDDLLTAAKRAILSAAQRIIVAGVDLRVAREEAMDDIRRAIGEAPPSVLEHAAALPPDDNTDDPPF